MGKSIKKSASKVDSPAVVAKPSPKSLKKGRGEEEEQIVKKSVIAKKQKLEAKKVDLKPKKKKEPSSDEEEEEEDEEVASEVDSEVDSEEDGIEVDSEDDASDAEVSDDEETDKADGKSGAGRTLYVGNLAFKVQESDVEEFFQSVGEVESVRLAEQNGKFRGFGHVVFATKEAAEKAVAELNGQDLLNRAVRLEMEKKDGKAKDAAKPSQKAEKADGVTVFVRGFGKDSSEDQTRKSLEKHFGTCGEITRVAIPKDPMGGIKGIAYIDFKDSDAATLALEKSGSKLGGQELYVDQAKPMSASGGGGRGGGRGRGGRGGGRGRGRGGRDGGGRFGGRDGGGRFGGGGGRGRGRRN